MADGTSAAIDKPRVPVPRTCILDGPTLVALRGRALAGDAALVPYVHRLRADADKALHDKPWNVTDKPMVAPSGDKHDYVSLASYFWPNPNTADGLPYVNRDGQLNPEGKQYDNIRLLKMCDAVETLSLAYYLTAEERYAQRVAEQVRVWFLDESTRMNPHLKYAQIVKGKVGGSSFGIIDTHRLAAVIDRVGMLEGSKAWTADDQRRLQAWFRQYLTWLTTSDPGRREAKSKNNHGTWYDVQTATFALFVGQEPLARQICENAKLRRIAVLIEPDGRQPAELRRTKSLHYTLFNLRGLFCLACVAQHVGIDLWSYQTADGRSIRKAVDFLLPYADGQTKWPYLEIQKINQTEAIVTALHWVFLACGDGKYRELIERLATEELRAKREWLIGGGT